MQAARGTSLNSTDPTSPSPTDPSVRRPRPARCVFAVVARRGVRRSTSAPRCSPSRRLDRPATGPRRRRPAASSPGPQPRRRVQHRHVVHRACSPASAIAAAVVVLWLGRRLGSTARGRSALGLLLAGVCGNLTDRIFRDARRPARPRRRLPRAAALAGLQRRRHVHQRRRGADHAAGLPRDPASTAAPGDATDAGRDRTVTRDRGRRAAGSLHGARTGSPASASTPRWRGCSASRAPAPPT